MPVVTLSVSNSIIDDIYMSSSSPTGTGNSSTIYVGRDTGSGIFRGLLKFDLGLIPNDAIINSATLSLNLSSPANSAQTINMHKVTGAWTEGVTTWNTAPSFDPNAFSSFTAGTVAGRINSINVKQLVQDWVNGIVANNGILLKNNNESTSGSLVHFTSSEGVSGDAPTLTIDYTIPSTGKKCVEYVGSNTPATVVGMSQTLTLPSYQAGDLLVAIVGVNSSTAVITVPSGWTPYLNQSHNGRKYVITTKTAQAGESNPIFTSSEQVTWASAVLVYRNVKSIPRFAFSGINFSTVFDAGTVTDVTMDKTLAVVINMTGQTPTSFTPPLSFDEKLDSTVGGFVLHSAQYYMYQRRGFTDLNKSSVTTNGSAYGIAALFVLEPKVNNSPTLTLTSPADNQTLSEGNVFSIQGSAGDTDNGNVVTAKYKINNGPTRAIASGVSDGSSPISFSKALTYSNKRLFDGSTDIVGADLAEGVDHTLTVWAEDDQGGKSAEITRKFRVIWNRPPTISGTDTDLGVISDPPSLTYSVSDPEGQSFTITEYLDGEVLRTFQGVAGQQYTVTIRTTSGCEPPLRSIR